MQNTDEKKYTIEDILEMLSGTEYYDDDTIKFIFNKVNGNKDEAEHYLNICLEKAQKIINRECKMKEENEIQSIDEVVTKVEEINENEIEK